MLFLVRKHRVFLIAILWCSSLLAVLANADYLFPLFRLIVTSEFKINAPYYLQSIFSIFVAWFVYRKKIWAEILFICSLSLFLFYYLSVQKEIILFSVIQFMLLILISIEIVDRRSWIRQRES